MKDGIDFRATLLHSWKLSVSSPLFFLFGGVSSLATLLQNFWLDQNKVFSTKDLFSALLAFDSEGAFSFGLFLFLTFLLSVFGKSSLTALTHEKRKDSEDQKKSNGTFLLLFYRGLKIEIIALFLFIFLFVILSLPVFVSHSYNPNNASMLLFLAVLTFIPLAFVLFLIKEFAFLYSVLTPLSSRQSFENSTRLFSRFPRESFLLGLLAFLLTLVFTFFVNLAMLLIAVLFAKSGFPEAIPSSGLILSFALFSWFFAFLRAFWTLSFISLAGPQAPDLKSENPSAFTERITEFPAA